MNKLRNWCKKEENGISLAKACLMACLPLLCCVVYCAAQGKSIGEVYLPASEWNDELFYFKQVEGIVKYGYPQGYFGFNESHALKLSFAAWSPVLVWPWILWGFLFGWNLLSPIICNIVLLTLAVFVFVWLVRPTWKQLGVCTLLFCLYTPFVRYMLSGMPEVICFSMLIVFYGVAYRYLQDRKNSGLVILFVLAGLLTLMRPYMLLFLLLPIFLWMRKSGWKGLIGSGVVLVIVVGAYAMIKHFLGAEYFAPLFFTDWITTFFEKGFGPGVRNFFGTLYRMGKEFLRHTKEGFRNGLASGAFFGGYLTMLAVLLGQSLMDFFRWKKLRTSEEAQEKTRKCANQLVVEAHLTICYIGMLFALLLMYKLTEGSKHLLTFMAVGIFVVGMMETKFYKKAVLIGAMFAYLYSYKAVDPYDYQVPFVTEELREQYAYWQQTCEQELILVHTKEIPNYDNVVIWTFNDKVQDAYISTKWQMLYGLPKGYGISCCMNDYVTEHLEELQSRYLAVVAGGSIDVLCQEAGYREVGRDRDLVLYERYTSEVR